MSTQQYYQEKTPPKREDRLQPCLAFGDTLCGLVRSGPACLATGNDRSFTQGTICALLPALGTLVSLEGAAVLLHGAVGCGSSNHGGNVGVRAGRVARGLGLQDALWFSTALDEKDVVMGGEEKLQQALLEIDERYSPKLIVAVATCIPGIIGDDIDAAAASVQERVRARIVPVHCEGFKSRFMAMAYDAYYHGFGRHLLDRPEGAADAEPERPLVNLMNVSSMGRVDEIELERLLNLLGLEVNIIPVFSRAEQFYRATQASLSISTCPTHDDYFLKYLHEKFGVPYCIRHMPIGIENTRLWLLDIAAFFGLEDRAREVIAAEEAALGEALIPFLPLLAGKKAFISAGEYRALATAGLLIELGFEITAVRAFHHDEFAEVEYKKLSAKSPKDFVFNVANCQPFEEVNLLKKLQPDVFLGHINANAGAAKLGVVTHVIYHIGQHCVGYKGVFEQARRFHRHLRNPSFVRKLAGQVPLPYSQKWYASDPFSRIRLQEEAEVAS